MLTGETPDGPKVQAQLDAETLRLRLTSPERAIRLEAADRNGYDALLMPLRLD